MVRTVRTFLPVAGQPDALVRAFEGDPVRWLPSARREGPDGFAIVVRGGSLSRTVLASVGAPWRAGSTRWRTLSWDPLAEDSSALPLERLLPSLDGELGLHIGPHDSVTLVLDARYQPPGGAVGTAADVVALGRVAHGTVERLVSDVAARLSAEALLLGDRSAAGDPPDEYRASAVRP